MLYIQKGICILGISCFLKVSRMSKFCRCVHLQQYAEVKVPSVVVCVQVFEQAGEAMQGLPVATLAAVQVCLSV
jgi:hypothetical protein